MRNPFTGMTHIFYAVPLATHARLSIYNIRGRALRTLVADWVDAGYHSVVWDGRCDSGDRVAPGLYFIRLSASDSHRTTKIVLER
jgi:flagellar hook assembly protein FlgD